jgi:DNA-binding LacI/PurR family transcriptional regulator
VSTKKPAGPIVSTSALARHLGLSRWTISRVLNGHSDVKTETSDRVRKAMEELAFVPSPAGRELRGGRTGIVGICFQALGSPIVARKIATLQRLLRKAGHRALCEVTDGDPNLELEVVKNFAAMRVDGLMLVGGMTDANAAAITGLVRAHNIPSVLVDPIRKFTLPTVELDREAGMRLVVEHMVELGHQRFALLGIDEAVPYGRARWQGIRAAAAKLGLSLEKQFVTLSESKPCALDFEYGSRLADAYLELPNPPTAALGLNDQVAVGAMSRLLHAGVKVPGDVSIVGFDNLDVSAHVTPMLTTVDQHVEKLMQAAVDMLTKRTDRMLEENEKRSAIAPVLVVRETSAPPATAEKMRRTKEK